MIFLSLIFPIMFILIILFYPVSEGETYSTDVNKIKSGRNCYCCGRRTNAQNFIKTTALCFGCGTRKRRGDFNKIQLLKLKFIQWCYSDKWDKIFFKYLFFLAFVALILGFLGITDYKWVFTLAVSIFWFRYLYRLVRLKSLSL